VIVLFIMACEAKRPLVWQPATLGIVCPGARRARGDIRSLFMSGYTANVIAHRGLLWEGVQLLQERLSLHDLAVKIQGPLERNQAQCANG
jgi:hypothetical protein